MADAAIVESKLSPSEVKMEAVETGQEQSKENSIKLSKEENGKNSEPPVCQSTSTTLPQDLGKRNSDEKLDKESDGQTDIVDPQKCSSTASTNSSKVEVADPGKVTEDGSNSSQKGDENKIGSPDKTNESKNMVAVEDASNLPEKVDKPEIMIPEKIDERVIPNDPKVKLEPQSPPRSSESTSGESLIDTGSVAKAEENTAAQKDNNTLESSVADVDGPNISTAKDLVTMKEETDSALLESKLQTKESEQRTGAISVPKVDENMISKENVDNENVKKENFHEESNDRLVTDAAMEDVLPQVVKDSNGQTNEENTSNMGAMLKAVKIEEVKPDEKLTVKANNCEENKTMSSEELKAPANIESQTSKIEKMQVDEVTPPLPKTIPIQKKEVLAPETIVSESKAVHEIIAEQSVRTERESAALSSIPISSEKTESLIATEASAATNGSKASLVENVPGPPLVANVPDGSLVTAVSGAILGANIPEASSVASLPEVSAAPIIPETKLEIKDAAGDDWDIPASDEEEGNDKPEGESGEKKKRVGVKRGYWEPPTEVIVELYRKLDQEGILELSWKCPGRRPPSEEGDQEEEKEQMKEEVDEEEMEISQEEEDPTEFDFDIDTDSSVQKMTPRRGIGTGQAQGSGKKRVARMDKVLSDIFRHRKIDSDLTNEKKQDAVPMETSEPMDTTPATNVTPSRPPDKFHIRSDLT